MARISIHVTPRSSKNEISKEGLSLKARLIAPPVDGAANEALIKLLADRLHHPRRFLHIVQGATSRQKTIEIDGLSAEEVEQRLGF